VKGFDKIFRRKPVVLLFIQLVQDLDLLVPIASGLQQCPLLSCRVMATDWVLAQSPRIQSTFSALGIPLQTVSRKAILRGLQPRLFGVRALITATESTAGPHRVAHTLTKRANQRGILTYTLQHGYENIGLNYSDAVYSPE
jgi:glycine/D-amino acid oxidase-like deaminating enzyme